MTTDEILCALDALAVQTGSLACLGCGHEHNCGIHGCAIIREAGKIIRWLSTDNTALRYAIKPAKVKRSQEQNFNGAVAYLRALIEEQRAQIEKAEAENAALREKQRWIPVTERLPEKQAWYHVAIRDKKTMRVSVEQDLYSVETAKNFGHEIGFCKANRWPEREELIAWMPLPDAPKFADILRGATKAPEEGDKHE